MTDSPAQHQKARAPLGVEKVADDHYGIIGSGGKVGVRVNAGSVTVQPKAPAGGTALEPATIASAYVNRQRTSRCSALSSITTVLLFT